MEKIDLTKCVNCRFRAKVYGNEVEGRIAVDGDYLRFFYDNGDIYSIHIPYYWEHGKVDYFDDLEIVPRDPETYRDWQVWDVMKNKVLGQDACNYTVIFRSGELVVIKDDNYEVQGLYTCVELARSDYRLVLTDIEQQIIDEKKKAEWTPQDGDVCYAESKTGYNDVFIYKAGYRKTEYYVATKTVPTTGAAVVSDNFIAEFRPATEEERQGLFDAMAKIGKRWNAEKKVVEDIPKPYEFSEFRKGDVVLYRDYGGFWKIGVFVEMRYGYDKYVTTTDGVDECGYRECIPYNERTMHLLGTTEDYKEE